MRRSFRRDVKRIVNEDIALEHSRRLRELCKFDGQWGKAIEQACQLGIGQKNRINQLRLEYRKRYKCGLFSGVNARASAHGYKLLRKAEVLDVGIEDTRQFKALLIHSIVKVATSTAPITVRLSALEACITWSAATLDRYILTRTRAVLGEIIRDELSSSQTIIIARIKKLVGDCLSVEGIIGHDSSQVLASYYLFSDSQRLNYDGVNMKDINSRCKNSEIDSQKRIHYNKMSLAHYTSALADLTGDFPIRLKVEIESKSAHLLIQNWLLSHRNNKKLPWLHDAVSFLESAKKFVERSGDSISKALLNLRLAQTFYYLGVELGDLPSLFRALKLTDSVRRAFAESMFHAYFLEVLLLEAAILLQLSFLQSDNHNYVHAVKTYNEALDFYHEKFPLDFLYPQERENLEDVYLHAEQHEKLGEKLYAMSRVLLKANYTIFR